MVQIAYYIYPRPSHVPLGIIEAHGASDMQNFSLFFLHELNFCHTVFTLKKRVFSLYKICGEKPSKSDKLLILREKKFFQTTIALYFPKLHGKNAKLLQEI